MDEKYYIFLSTVCALFIFNSVECATNESPGIQLECWPNHFQQYKYVQFKIDLHLVTSQKWEILTGPSPILMKNLSFNPTNNTTVIVHGFLDRPFRSEIMTLKNELLAMDRNMNIIILDWQAGCYNPFMYHRAVINTRTAAHYLAEVISNTTKHWKTNGIKPKDWGLVHFIGHSLGAHVVGQAARYLHEEKNLAIDRVTALDPAEPCFEKADFPLRLQKTAAKFVDVIHTDGAFKSRNTGYGLYEPLGDIDFYPNGGKQQPGCPIRRRVRKQKVLDIGAMIIHTLFNGECSHSRAWLLFTESVRQERLKQCKFWAHPWRPGSRVISENTSCNVKSCQQMGINAKLPTDHESSTYYLTTTDAEPFCNVR